MTEDNKQKHTTRFLERIIPTGGMLGNRVENRFMIFFCRTCIRKTNKTSNLCITVSQDVISPWHERFIILNWFHILFSYRGGRFLTLQTFFFLFPGPLMASGITTLPSCLEFSLVLALKSHVWERGHIFNTTRSLWSTVQAVPQFTKLSPSCTRRILWPGVPLRPFHFQELRKPATNK